MSRKPLTAQEQHHKMLNRPISRLVLQMALPTTVSQLIAVIYNTADTYFVSHLGTSASAAMGVGFSLMSIIQAFGFGVGMGMNSLISRRLGAKQDKEAEMYASSGFLLEIIGGICLLVFGLLFLTPLMKLLGATETMLPYASDYCFYILLGAPVMCMAYAMNNILRSEGEPVYAMLGLGFGGLLNVGLDPLFIYTFGLGMRGAAIATIISQLASALILMASFVTGRSIVLPRLRSISRSLTTYLTIFKLGIPTMIRQGMASLASALLTHAAGAFADSAVAAVTISNKVYLFVRNVVVGIGQGLQPVAGYNFGAGDKKRTRAAFSFACKLGTAICLCAAVFLFIFAPNVISWFRDDPDVIRVGALALKFASCVMPLMAYSTYVNQLLQCLGFTLPATILAACRNGICFVPVILILPRILGLTGVQMAQPCADLMTFLISIPFQVWFFRKILR